MNDETEDFRREKILDINLAIESQTPEREKIRLAEIYGSKNVWLTRELQVEFDVVSFLAPYASVVRKADGVKGTVQFQHSPRVYFNFQPN